MYQVEEERDRIKSDIIPHAAGCLPVCNVTPSFHDSCEVWGGEGECEINPLLVSTSISLIDICTVTLSHTAPDFGVELSTNIREVHN